MTTGDGQEARRSVGGVLAAVVIAAALGAVAVALTFLTREEAEPYVLAVVCGLAALGGVFLAGLAFGGIRFGGEPAPPPETVPETLADGLPEGLLVTDPAGRVVTANAAYAALAGAARRDAVPSLERLLAGDPDAAGPLFRLAAAARQGVAADEEVRLAHPIGQGDGGPRWYRLSVRPLAGTPPRRLWRVADVTGERHDQEASFLELQTVVHFLDDAPAGFFSAAGDGRLVYLNATLAGWLGHDLARLDAETLADLVGEEAAAVLGAFTGTPGEVRTETLDLDLVRRDGDRLAARLLHRITFGADGAAQDSRTLVLPRDAVGAAAGAPAATEARFARFFNTAPIAIAAIDRDGRVGRANAPFLKLFGGLAQRPPGEPRRRLVEAVAERDREALAAALAAAAGSGPIAPVDAALAGDGGRSVRFYISPVRDAAAGDDEAAIAYVLDTTEQRALETQFAQSQKMQAVGQLAGGVAHDFNNLLTVIIGFADLVLTRYRPNDPFFQDIMQIKQNANRAAGLVRQLLAFSRRQTMRPERIVLNDVLAELSLLLDRLLGETVELKVVNGRDLWPVMADANQFEQVIVNLAVNARDAMPDGGRLTIRTANVPAAEAAAFAAHGIPAGDYVMTEIADTGRGMSAEVMEKIFEPFFTTKEFGKGTGLGLSTVYGIVKQSNGYITVDSSPGEGTTFRVLLPRASGEAAAWPTRGDDDPAILVRGGGPAEPRPRLVATEPAAVEKTAAALAGPAAPASGAASGPSAGRAAPAATPPSSGHADAAGPSPSSARASEAATPSSGTAAAAGATAETDTPPAIADLTGSAAILLVEDEDAVRAFATRALASRGYVVHPAASGAEALKVMEEVGGRIDLVVSDVVMPEMDGPTLLRELRRSRPDLKIIFVSGYAEDAFARNLPAGEHFSFLPKPFTLKQLATTVKAVLAGEETRPE